jgi:hypothetical protein
VIALLALLVAIGLGLVAATYAGGSPSSLAITAIRAGGWIALVRVGLYWAALALYIGHADWRQIAGYALLVTNSVVELAIVGAVTGSRPAGLSVAVAGMIVVTSGLLGLAWAWLRR